MAIFKKLNIGDVVATSGTKVFRKLTTAEVTPEDPTLPVWNGTDLTGTTWKIPVGWTAEAEYGYFDVYGYAHTDSISVGFHDFYIGYDREHSITGPIFAAANNIVYLTLGFASFKPTTETTFEFSGGADTTNPRLIGWLLLNGRLTSHRFADILAELAIEGTWVFNDTIEELPIFDDTVEDVYNDDWLNIARFIKVDVLRAVNTTNVHNLVMRNRVVSAFGGETVVLGTSDPLAKPFYYYERNEFLQEYYWSENAYNELTILFSSSFRNYSGVNVSKKLLGWLLMNARKK